MELITHRKHAVNVGQAERIASAIGGGLLTAAALKRRSSASIALGLIGVDLLRRSLTGHCHIYEAIGIRTAPKGQGAESTSVPYELGIRVDKAITIARPRAEVYQFWRNLENLPRFMKNVLSVAQTGTDRTHWAVCAPAGRTVEWDAELINESDGERIAWRSLPGGSVDHAGSVQFKDAPGGRGTEVKVELQYNPPAGALGAAFASLWGKEPGQQIEQDLHRLKQILETGELATTEGQTSGRGLRKIAKANEARDREVHAGSVESFPASDAPVYNP